jgi:hypothetical protein
VSEGVLFFMESDKFIRTNATRASSISKKHNVEAWLTFGTLLSTARMVIVGCGETALALKLVQFCDNRAISSAQKSSWIFEYVLYVPYR